LKWSALGSGLVAGSTPFGTVLKLAAFDPDDVGPLPAELYVGGPIIYAGSLQAKNIARWNGANWSGVDGGTNNYVTAMHVSAVDGTRKLYVGGAFDEPAPFLATWNGQAWAAPPDPGPYIFSAMTTFDEDGPLGPTPPALYGGVMYGTESVRRWIPNVGWQSLGQKFLDTVLVLAAFDEDTSGPLNPTLYAAGQTLSNGKVNPAKWDGVTWKPVIPGGTGLTYSAYASAFEVYDPDDGGPEPPALYMGGRFLGVDGVSSQRVAALVACPQPPLCPGDLDGDSSVGQSDLGILLANYGCNEGLSLCSGDADGDGDTDQSDLGMLLSNYGETCPQP
jgi:hypothetical protein